MYTPNHHLRHMFQRTSRVHAPPQTTSTSGNGCARAARQLCHTSSSQGGSHSSMARAAADHWHAQLMKNSASQCTRFIIIMLPSQAIASTPSAPRPTVTEAGGSTASVANPPRVVCKSIACLTSAQQPASSELRSYTRHTVCGTDLQHCTRQHAGSTDTAF
ncbi:hypothetical protein COO60DRAFT_1520619, partial [Scenedesmus sp. NREL 46B-D3]